MSKSTLLRWPRVSVLVLLTTGCGHPANPEAVPGDPGRTPAGLADLGTSRGSVEDALEEAHVVRRAGHLQEARARYLRLLMAPGLVRRGRESALRGWSILEREHGDAALGQVLRLVLALDARRAADRITAWRRLIRTCRSKSLAVLLTHACIHLETRVSLDDTTMERLRALCDDLQ